MSQPIPRLRVFAGPNGSGKSTIKDSLLPQWLGVYVNADDIEKAIRTQGFLGHHLLRTGKSFTFETVMSSPDKVDFMRRAREQGFRTYLYFVATEDPEINIERVRNRVLNGGHPVPEDKIISRYHRSLELLPAAVEQSSRAYVFDNSNHARTWIAEITDGDDMELQTDQMPHWFRTALWDPFAGTADT
ncbi:MAG: hypothetical protein RL489_1240 [Pseudomonadota bacterium]|jgi:predicted ABC-type ATPase